MSLKSCPIFNKHLKLVRTDVVINVYMHRMSMKSCQIFKVHTHYIEMDKTDRQTV